MFNASPFKMDDDVHRKTDKKAPDAKADSGLTKRDNGTQAKGVMSPLLANLLICSIVSTSGWDKNTYKWNLGDMQTKQS
ncbi:MAG: hypothetical protein IPN94_24280 [Sphingobacteriales bacterium]|nr:hypothetical protein [Sphingobacteriales bacterium]